MVNTNRIALANVSAYSEEPGLIVLQMGFVFMLYMNTFFDTRPITTTNWLYPVAAGVLVFLLVELEKFIILEFQKSKPKQQ